MSGKFDRRTYLKGAGTIGAAALAGCVGSFGGGGGGAKYNVGMVYALGGLGDKSFNDMAHKGIQDAADDFDLEFNNAEPEKASEFKTLQNQFADSNDPDYDLISCIGFAQTSALKANAKKYPDQNFMLVDSVVDRDNVSNYVFKEHQGSFQVGHLAGLMTTRDFSHETDNKTLKTNDDPVVGFVGGKKIDLIKKFQAGYEAGVKHANSDVTIKSAYAGAWNDAAKGKEIALSMYEDGADIVYHAAGGTGIGVFKAAREEGRFAIGVDADQSESTDFDDVIMASMVKHVDTAVYRAAETIVNDEFEGAINALGLQKDGVEAIIGTGYEGEIPSEVTSALDDSQQKIVDGDISVPQKPENVGK